MTPPRPALPAITSPLSPTEAVDRLDRLSKRGKLPGFERDTAGSRSAFRALIFGAPYDRELRASAHAIDGAPAGGCTIRAQSVLKLKLPAIVAVVLILSVWPGLPLTDSMLKTYFSWYRIPTWWWYLPLMLLGLPPLWKQWKNSERVAAEETEQLLRKIAEEIMGVIDSAAEPSPNSAPASATPTPASSPTPPRAAP